MTSDADQTLMLEKKVVQIIVDLGELSSEYLGVVNMKDFPLSDQPSSFLALTRTSYWLSGWRPKKVNVCLNMTPSYLWTNRIESGGLILDLPYLSLSFLLDKGGIMFVQFDLLTVPFLFCSYNLLNNDL